MKCRFIEPIGIIYSLIGIGRHDDSSITEDKLGNHRGEIIVTKEEYDKAEAGMVMEFTCQYCGKKFITSVCRSYRPKYNTESGDPEPYTMYYSRSWFNEKLGKCMCGWENCDGNHLVVILPNKHPWDTSMRARNCGRPEDKKHRCWVVHGEAPNITIDKNGDTCQAGAGSISVPGWHGFLRNGELVEC